MQSPEETLMDQVVSFVDKCKSGKVDALEAVDTTYSLACEISNLRRLTNKQATEVCKTVRVTNPRNVLVQIPSHIIAKWNPATFNYLEVSYNEYFDEVRIKPAIRR